MFRCFDANGVQYDRDNPVEAVGIDADGVLYSLDAPGTAVGIDANGTRYAIATPGSAVKIDADGNRVGVYNPSGGVEIDAFGNRSVLTFAQLTHSLPETNKYSATFGNANRTVTDCYGAIQQVLSGEARFYGALRVCNLIADSEGFVTGWTLGTNVTKSSVLPKANPTVPNRKTLYTFTRSSGTDYHLTLNSLTYKHCQTTFSIDIDGDLTGEITIRFEKTTGSVEVVSYTFTPVAGVNRYAFTFTPSDTTTQHRVRISTTATGASSITVACAQMEETYLQTGVCNYYVSRGVLSAPFHGAAVDGVRYFDEYTPYRWVSGSSGVVTGGRATPIPATTLKGILIEPISGNKLLHSNTFSNAAWTKTNVTLGAAVDSAFAKSSLVKLEETAVTAVHGVTALWSGSAVSGATSGVTLSASVVAAERTWAYLEMHDGTSAIGSAYFNLATGAVGTVTGSNANAEMWAEGSGWRIAVTADAGANFAGFNGVAIGRLYVATGNGTNSYAGSAGSGIYAGEVQWEAFEAPTHYCGNTTTAAISHVADVFQLTSTNAFPGVTNFAMTCDITAMCDTGTIAKAQWWYFVYGRIDANNRFGWTARPGLKGGASSDARAVEWAADYYPNSASWDGLDITERMYRGNTKRAGWGYGTVAQHGSSGVSMVLDSEIGAIASGSTNTTTFTLSGAVPNIALGAQTAGGAVTHPGCYKNLSIYQRQYTEAQLIALP